MSKMWIDRLKEDTDKYDRDCDKGAEDYDKDVKEKGRKWDDSVK